MFRFVFALLLATSSITQAQIHRCTGAQGEPLFQGRPCESGTSALVSLHGLNAMSPPGRRATPLTDRRIAIEKRRAAAGRRALDRAAYHKREQCQQARRASRGVSLGATEKRLAIASRILHFCF